MSESVQDPVALFEGLDEDGGGELSLQAVWGGCVGVVSAPVDAVLLVSRTKQDLDEEDGNLYWNFQEFCVLKFRKGVEDRPSHLSCHLTCRKSSSVHGTVQKDFMRNMGSCHAWEQADDVKVSFSPGAKPEDGYDRIWGFRV